MSDGGRIYGYGGPVSTYVNRGEWRIARSDVPPLPDPWRRVLFVQPPPMPEHDDPEDET